jgi:hypothetical protein
MKDIGRIFIDSQVDAWRALTVMGQAIILLALGSVLARFVSDFTEPMIGTRFGRLVLNWLVATGMAWATAPAIVALYRCFLLGDERSDPNPFRRSQAIETYFAAATYLSLVAVVPLLIYALFETPGDATGDAARLSSLTASLGPLILTWIVITRLTTLLPGIAIGRPALWQTSFAESRGRFWFIAIALPVAIAPVFVVDVAVNFALRDAPSLFRNIVEAIPATAVAVVAMAATSQLYRRLAPAPPNGEPSASA